MTSILLVPLNVLASLGLLGLLVALGTPVYALARRFALTDRAPLGLSAIVGLAWLSTWSWYGIAAGIRPTSIYRGLMIAAPPLACIALTFRHGRPDQDSQGAKALAADVGFDLMAFTVSVLVYTGLIFSELTTDDLPWATIGDGDLYVYLKAASWLSLTPTAVSRVGWTDFDNFVRVDVFGCFNLLAFGRFALRTAGEHLAIPTLGVGVGLVGVAVARSCRLGFHLNKALSIAVSLVTTTGPLFLYVVLNYFLSQILFLAILLTVVLQSPEAKRYGRREGAGRSLMVASGAVAVLLCYDVWAIQFAIMVPMVLAIVELVTRGGRWWKRAWNAASSLFASAALTFAAMAAVSPTRLHDAVDKLRTFSVPNGTGWALPFVDPELLLSLPSVWHSMDVPRSGVSGQSLVFVLTLAVLVLATAKLDRQPGILARRLILGCFLTTVCAYYVIWFRLGETYQQWKFASSLPLGFGFSVPATAIRLSTMEPTRTGRRLTGLTVAAFLVACVALNVDVARHTWMTSLVHSPAALADLARALDAMPMDGPVHVTIDDFYTRHVPLVMLNHRPVTFDGPTMFGLSTAPLDGSYRTEITTPCAPSDDLPVRFLRLQAASDYLPLLPAGRGIALSGSVATCVALSGFGSAKPWGRGTDAAVASIRFRCGCPPTSRGYRLVVRARMPEGTESGKLRLTIAGSPTPVNALLGPDFREIAVPLPKEIRDEEAVIMSLDVSAVTPNTQPTELQVALLTVMAND